jgi:hypothetical protein
MVRVEEGQRERSLNEGQGSEQLLPQHCSTAAAATAQCCQGIRDVAQSAAEVGLVL